MVTFYCLTPLHKFQYFDTNLVIQINWLGFLNLPFLFFPPKLYKCITNCLGKPFLDLSFYYADSFIFQKFAAAQVWANASL